MGQGMTSLPTGIGRPATSALAEQGVTPLEEVTGYTRTELLALHGVGPEAVGVLEESWTGMGCHSERGASRRLRGTCAF